MLYDKPLIYGSVCSGIEAATAAWHPLRWKPAFFSEIEPFPRSVLQHHYPNVPLHGDFTTIKDNDYAAINLLVGGTPCQAFSVAGLRKGFADERGNLTLEYVRLAQRLKPRWLVWENVPGVLSIDGGRAFGSFLGGLAECGYGFAYRILDAQYFGVPQRRRRVFVIGYLGDWRPAAAVLFERESLLGDITPSRQTGEKPSPTISARTKGGGGLGTDFDLDGGLIHCPAISPAMKARDHKGPSSDGDGDGLPLIAHALRAEGFDAGEDGTGGGTPLLACTLSASEGGVSSGTHPIVPVAIQERAVCENPNAGPGGAGFRTDGIAYTLEARTVPQAVAYRTNAAGQVDAQGECTAALTTMTDPTTQFIAFAQNTRDEVRLFGGDGQIVGALAAEPGMKQQSYVAAFKGGQGAAAGSIGYDEHLSPTLNSADSGSNRTPALMTGMQVRRLTPRECERLQGFSDDYTLVPFRNKPAADGNRYKALGNSMAVPVMRWLGERIQMIEDLQKALNKAA